MKQNKLVLIKLMMALGFLAGCVLIGAGLVQAQTDDTAVSPPVPPTSNNQAELLNTLLPATLAQSSASNDDAACILCHADTDAVIELASGEVITARVDTAVLDGSAHGQHGDEPIGCTDCHSAADYQYPHEPVTAPDLQAYQAESSTLCSQCHTTAPHLTSHRTMDSETPASCVSCHGGHNVITQAQWQAGEGRDACTECHTVADVRLNDPDHFLSVIQGGLFDHQYVTNDYCFACHSQEGIPSDLPEDCDHCHSIANVDPTAFHNSVHGDSLENGPLQCVQCHENYIYPHEHLPSTTGREYSLEMSTICAKCHETKYESALDDVHGRALAEGNVDAAVCTDCHGAHDTPIPNEPRERISQTCRQCHSTIYDDYATSVHGEALIEDSNEDVPTCIDCHSVHNISDPTTSLFRVRSPELCASCHADDELMNKYDISTEVFDTYVADFHGTTVTLFEHDDPNAETNKAVCYDCHGVHDIRRPDDPESGIKANLLETCQQCHPDAGANFPDSWTSHFQPSLQHNPLVYLVNLFYQIVIPFTLALFGFLVATDIYRRVRTRFSQ